MQKASFFAAALSDRSFRASPSSLKRDVNNSIQGSRPNLASGTVAQRSGGAHTERMRSRTVSSSSSSTDRHVQFLFFFFTYFSFLSRQKYLIVAAAPGRLNRRSCVC